MNEKDNNPARHLRIFLRDHRVLDAHVRIPEGQHLAPYLANRTRYVNLTAVEWVSTGEQIPHMALKVDAILWVSSLDRDLPLTGALAAADARMVEVEMEGGYLVAAGLCLLENQRLTDYLHSAPVFIPLRDAALRPRQTRLGDVVVNQNAIQLVWELAGPDVRSTRTGTTGRAGTARS